VEVALEPAALGEADGDHPAALLAELGNLGRELGPQALLLEGQRCPGADGLDQLRLVQERRVMHHRGDRTAMEHDVGDRAPGWGRGQLHRVPVGVDVPL
jgi:hypothetical protein